MSMISRRRFLANAAVSAAACTVAGREHCLADAPLDFPLVDFHVHVEGAITLDKALEISKRKGVKFGIVEHAGDKQNKYPRVLSNDEELGQYIDALEGKPVYKGIQAEWVNWRDSFSQKTLSRLDYVLTDAMTMPGKDGRRTKLWEKDYAIGNSQSFMDRYVDFHVEIMARQPIDILANTTWLPAEIAEDYEKLWTPSRMKKVIEAAVKHGLALEINSSYRVPKLSFLRMAKEAGVTFSFGSNIRGPEVGNLDYCVQVARAIGLSDGRQMFTPVARKKAVERR